MNICVLIFFILIVRLDAFYIPFDAELDHPQLRHDLPPSTVLSDYLYLLALRKLKRSGFNQIETEDDLKYSQDKQLRMNFEEASDLGASYPEIVVSNREKLAGIDIKANCNEGLDLNSDNAYQTSYDNSHKNVQQSVADAEDDIIVENLEDIPVSAAGAIDPIIHILPSEEASNDSEIFDSVFEDDESQLRNINDDNVKSLADIMDIAEDFDETHEVDIVPVDDLIAQESIKEEAVSIGIEMKKKGNETIFDFRNSAVSNMTVISDLESQAARIDPIVVDAAQLPENNRKATLESFDVSNISDAIKNEPVGSTVKDDDAAHPEQPRIAFIHNRQKLEDSWIDVQHLKSNVTVNKNSPEVAVVNAGYVPIDSDQKSKINQKEQQSETIPVSAKGLSMLLENSLDDEVKEEMQLRYQVSNRSVVANTPLISSTEVKDSTDGLPRLHNYSVESNVNQSSTIPMKFVKEQDGLLKWTESIAPTNKFLHNTSEETLSLLIPPRDQLELNNNLEDDSSKPAVSFNPLEQVNELTPESEALKETNKISAFGKNISDYHEITLDTLKSIPEMIHNLANVSPRPADEKYICTPTAGSGAYSQLRLAGLDDVFFIEDDLAENSSSKKRILNMDVDENSNPITDDNESVSQLPDEEVPLSSPNLNTTLKGPPNQATFLVTNTSDTEIDNSPMRLNLMDDKIPFLGDWKEDVDQKPQFELHELQTAEVNQEGHEPSLMYQVVHTVGEGISTNNDGRNVDKALPIGEILLKINSFKKQTGKHRDEGRSDIPIDYE